MRGSNRVAAGYRRRCSGPLPCLSSPWRPSWRWHRNSSSRFWYARRAAPSSLSGSPCPQRYPLTPHQPQSGRGAAEVFRDSRRPPDPRMSRSSSRLPVTASPERWWRLVISTVQVALPGSNEPSWVESAALSSTISMRLRARRLRYSPICASASLGIERGSTPRAPRNPRTACAGGVRRSVVGSKETPLGTRLPHGLPLARIGPVSPRRRGARSARSSDGAGRCPRPTCPPPGARPGQCGGCR